MRCPRCRHDNPARAKFCLECGQRLALACLACGAELPETAKFCPECGRPVAAAGAAAPAEPARAEPEARTPATYTPRHLAERILTSRGALEGERKPVTVLFCDPCAPTAGLTETDTPEAIVEKARFGLQELGLDPSEGAPYLLRLLGGKDPEGQLDVLGPEVIKARTFETLRQMCLRGSRKRPLVLEVEDLTGWTGHPRSTSRSSPRAWPGHPSF